MQVVMINDCAFVGETLLKYMPANIKKWHIKRSRNLWSKTFGIAYRIWKVKGEIYHVHYLLQDCYIADRLKRKPLIGHAHGSDLRITLKNPLWGRIVKHNLKSCERILVSTPDILGLAKQLRNDVEYLPNPVDEWLFYPKPLSEECRKKRVLIASESNWSVKGTDIAIRALSKIKDEVKVSIIGYGVDFERTVNLARSLDLKLNILHKVSHNKMHEYYWNADVVLDSFKLGSLGMVSLESIACGRPVVTYVSSEYDEYKDFPLKDVRSEEAIADAIMNATAELWEMENTYLQRHHKPEFIVKQLLNIYYNLVH